MLWFWVGGAAAVGAMLRYGTGHMVAARVLAPRGPVFPLAVGLAAASAGYAMTGSSQGLDDRPGRARHGDVTPEHVSSVRSLGYVMLGAVPTATAGATGTHSVGGRWARVGRAAVVYPWGGRSGGDLDRP